MNPASKHAQVLVQVFNPATVNLDMAGFDIVWTHFRLKTGASAASLRNAADSDSFSLIIRDLFIRAGGSDAWTIGTNGIIQAASTGHLQWSSTGVAGGTKDVGLKRNAAGVALVTNGSTGAGSINALKTVLAKTSTYAVAVTDSGTAFTNEGAGAKIDFNLPSAAAGLRYSFTVQDADGLRAVAAAGDTIRVAGAVGAAAGNVDSTTVGSTIELLAINATEWVAQGTPSGTWILS